jgi:hypothetical protein
MGSESSSREIASQRSQLPLNFGIQAVQSTSQPVAISNQAQGSSTVQEGAAAPPQTHAQSLPSISFRSVVRAQDWNWGDQNDDAETGFHPALDHELSSLDASREFEDMFGYFS